jgi:calpain-7
VYAPAPALSLPKSLPNALYIISLVAYHRSDTHDLSLSVYQQQFFKGWARAAQAVPPPSLFPGGREGLGPVMTTPRSIDLVQDAATDCSVVASLCAAIARAERGHDQVGRFGVVYPLC